MKRVDLSNIEAYAATKLTGHSSLLTNGKLPFKMTTPFNPPPHPNKMCSLQQDISAEWQRPNNQGPQQYDKLISDCKYFLTQPQTPTSNFLTKVYQTKPHYI